MTLAPIRRADQRLGRAGCWSGLEALVSGAATGGCRIGLDDRRLIPLHRRNQPIAAARQGLDESRGLGRVSKRFAQPLHRRVHSVLEVDECVVLPEPLTQFLAGDQLTGALHQALEHLEGLLLKAHTHAGLSQLAHAKVQLERAKPHHLTARSGCLTHDPPLR